MNVSDIILQHKSDMGYVGICPDACIKILSQSAILNVLWVCSVVLHLTALSIPRIRHSVEWLGDDKQWIKKDKDGSGSNQFEVIYPYELDMAEQTPEKTCPGFESETSRT